MAKGRKTGGRVPTKNRVEIRGSMAVLFLKEKQRAHEAYIDASDLGPVQSVPYAWWAVKYYNTYYAKTTLPAQDGGRSRDVFLHHVIAGTPLRKLVVDHINHNRLDNTRKNLRITDQVVNGLNRRGPNRNSKSGIRGVSWDKARQKWTAHITISDHMTPTGRRVKSLGRFGSQKDAEAAIRRSLHAQIEQPPCVP